MRVSDPGCPIAGQPTSLAEAVAERAQGVAELTDPEPEGRHLSLQLLDDSAELVAGRWVK